jgi:hypothetical protein
MYINEKIIIAQNEGFPEYSHIAIPVSTYEWLMCHREPGRVVAKVAVVIA